MPPPSSAKSAPPRWSGLPVFFAAGVIFYTDIGVPVVGFVLLWLQYRLGRESTSPERAPGEVVGA